MDAQWLCLSVRSREVKPRSQAWHAIGSPSIHVPLLPWSCHSACNHWDREALKNSAPCTKPSFQDFSGGYQSVFLLVSYWGEGRGGFSKVPGPHRPGPHRLAHHRASGRAQERRLPHPGALNCTPLYRSLRDPRNSRTLNPTLLVPTPPPLRFQQWWGSFEFHLLNSIVYLSRSGVTYVVPQDFSKGWLFSGFPGAPGSLSLVGFPPNMVTPNKVWSSCHSAARGW